MAEHDPLRANHLMQTARPCNAHSKQTGKPCRQPAIPGGFVCRYHGGKAPQVVRKAQERLAELVEPAIARLAKLVDGDNPSVALGAVKDVLDRNYLGTQEPTAQTTINLTKIENVIVRPPDTDR